MRQGAFILVFSVVLAARAEELSPHTRTVLHEALEAQATVPVDPPSLPQSTLRPRLGTPASEAAVEQATRAANRAQTEAAKRAAQDVANGVGRNNTANDASRNAAGQQRAAEAKASGGSGASHPHGPPSTPGKPTH